MEGATLALAAPVVLTCTLTRGSGRRLWRRGATCFPPISLKHVTSLALAEGYIRGNGCGLFVGQWCGAHSWIHLFSTFLLSTYVCQALRQVLGVEGSKAEEAPPLRGVTSRPGRQTGSKQADPMT